MKTCDALWTNGDYSVTCSRKKGHTGCHSGKLCFEGDDREVRD